MPKPSLKFLKVSSDAEMQQAFDIREEVFVKEQEVPVDLEIDEHEKTSSHYLLFVGDEAAGTARLRTDGSKLHFERIAILKKFRGQGLGKKLMQFLMQEASNVFPQLTPHMHAQVQAIPFYEQLGWKVCSNVFMDAGIEHVSMQKTT